MEKIKLKDGTTIEIQAGCSEFSVSMIAESVDEMVANFTDENLERFKILTEGDAVCAIYEKKHMKKFSAEVAEEGGYLITVTLEDVDEVAERLASLEETVDTLVMESLGL